MNFQAIQSNHGLMPVKTEYTSLDGYISGEHIYYVNSSSINNSAFTDIYPFANTIYSLGDILIIFGFSAFVIYSVVMMHKYHKWRKREKLLEIMRSPSVTYNIQLPKPL